MESGGSRPSSNQGDENVDERSMLSSAPTKPGDETQDLFILTGTTFAGTTDMNSTAGPSDTRPSTEGTRMDQTRPGTVLPATMEEGAGEDASSASSARHNKLLIEAELRAEHQAAARATMLDLAHALDQSNQRAKDLAKLLKQEYDVSANLRVEVQDMKDEMERMLLEEEKRMAQVLVDKAVSSGNNMVFSMLLEKSRKGYDYSIFDEDMKIGGSMQPGTRDFAAGGCSFGGVAGDKVMIGWCIKLWHKEVGYAKIRRQKEAEEEERRRREEEMKRQLEEAKRLAIEQMQKVVKDLEIQLERALKVADEQAAKYKELEKELVLSKELAAREAKLAKAREEALQAELTETKAALVQVREELVKLKEDYLAAQEALKKADAAFDDERNRLKAVIRQIQSELQEAMVLAKHMRETALKAKRDAAGSVSPSKFAELIAQLEQMKSQLSVLQKDCRDEKENNTWLLLQLDKNKRQIELERQFLPLLRKVRGPVGPKVKGAIDDSTKRPKDATQVQQKTMPPLTANGSPNKMRMSQSMGDLTTGRAVTAGGPLPGGRASGFIDDQTRFASSLGFAGSGQGTPLRG